MIRKILLSSVSILMFLFAFVQINDPDSWIWILIYLIISIFGILSLKNNIPKIFYFIVFIIQFVWIISLLPSFIDWLSIENGHNLMSQSDIKKSYFEESREFLGLTISMICLMIIYFLNRKKLQ